MFLGQVATSTYGAATPPLAPVTSQNTWQSLITSLSTLGTAIIGYNQQKDLAKLNIQRAQQGLPPITAADAGVMPPTVAVGIDPNLKLILTYGLLGAGGLIALNTFLKHRR